MSCEGILPDGNQCTCPDEYTSSETGLCASCGAPESTALVPMGSTSLMADPRLDALYGEMSPKTQAFLKAYTKTRTVKGAAEACGISRQSHHYWMKHTSGYAALVEVAELDALDHVRELYADRVENGLKETEYDAGGNVTRIRIRQSEGLLKALMVAKDPEFTPDKGTGSNVTINVIQVKEGGWGSEEDQVPREVGRIEVASVDEDEGDE